MKIGDILERDDFKGVVVFIDDCSGHGLIMSLDEAFGNWYEADKWCKNLGDGWFMPSLNDFEMMKDDENLNKIQTSLIRHGMPLCFGDSSIEGTNKGGHMYWTRNFCHRYKNDEIMSVFCLCSSGFYGISEDYKEAEYEYIRAMHRF